MAGARVLAQLGASEAGLALRGTQHRRANDAAFCLALVREVAYDVVDDRRRGRVAQVLEDYGVRVQYSVFECRLARTRNRQLRAALAARIDAAEDAVAFYRLGNRCGERVQRIGRPPLPTRIRSS